MKIYTIIYEGSHYDLAEHVRELMKDGWQPQGGVSAHTVAWGQIWAQAMVK